MFPFEHIHKRARRWIALAALIALATVSAWLWLRIRSHAHESSPSIASSSSSTEATAADAIEAEHEDAREARTPVPPTLPPAVEVVAPVHSARVFGRIIDDRTNRPLANAAIDLVAHRKDAATLVAHVLSSDDGSFELNATEDASLAAPDAHAADAFVPVMTVRLDGYAPVHFPPWKNGGDHSLRRGMPMNCRDIRLTRGALISGRVVDLDGHGIADATLLLAEDCTGFEGSALFTPYVIGHTDADGRMKIDDRVPALNGMSNWLLAAASARGIGWQSLAVLDGRESIDDVEVRIREQGSIQVHVVDTDGNPIEGALVRIEPEFLPLRYLLPQINHAPDDCRCEPLCSIASARSDASGDATIAPLPASARKGDGRGFDAKYNMVAFHEGFLATQLQHDFSKGVLLTPKSSRGEAKIVMQRMRPCTVSGRVTDKDSHAIPGATVTLHDQSPVACDVEGRFMLGAFDPSCVGIGITAGAPGFASQTRPVTLSTTQDVTDVDFVLDHPLPIEGRVVDQFGAAVAIAMVSARRDNSSSYAVTSNDGRFVLPDTTEGTWELRWSPPEFRRFDLTTVDRKTVQAGDRSVQLVLTRLPPSSALLTADVVDAHTGEFLEPKLVELVGDTGGKVWRLECERSFGHVRAHDVPAGAWRLWVSVAERATGFTEFKVSEGESSVHVDVRIAELAALAVKTVLDPTINRDDVDVLAQLAVPNLQLPAWERVGSRWTLSGYTRKDADGTYHYADVLPGKWRFTLTGAGLHNVIEVDVEPGKETYVELTGKPAATLHFVSDVGDENIRVFVEVVRADGAKEPQFMPPRPKYGRFEDDVAVREGSYRWSARFCMKDDRSHEIAEAQNGELTIRDGERRRVDIAFVPK